MNATSHTKQCALPDEWVARIFGYMSCLYGNKFVDLWNGTDHKAVRALWAEKLGGFRDRPEVIMAALDALDDRPLPPTLPEFIALCRAATTRSGTRPALPEPAIDDATARERLRQIKARFFGSKATHKGASTCEP